MRPAFNRIARPALWVLFALPAALMLNGWLAADTLTLDLIAPSGDMAVRLIILALLPGPLTEIFGPNRWLRGWLAIRRNLGVAAFCYGLLHLALYTVDLGALAAMIDEIGLPGIWTGWLALALLVPAAATSSDRAMRRLGRRWKSIQIVVYPALVLTIVHWLLLEPSASKALLHAAPLLMAWSARAAQRTRILHRRPT